MFLRSIYILDVSFIFSKIWKTWKKKHGANHCRLHPVAEPAVLKWMKCPMFWCSFQMVKRVFSLGKRRRAFCVVTSTTLSTGTPLILAMYSAHMEMFFGSFLTYRAERGCSSTCTALAKMCKCSKIIELTLYVSVEAENILQTVYIKTTETGNHHSITASATGLWSCTVNSMAYTVMGH